MLVNSFSNFYHPTNYLYANKAKTPSFEGGGKPITLQYAVEKRAYLFPERVLKVAKELLAKSSSELPSLKMLHKSIYEPLMSCKSLDEAKAFFPEFASMKENVVFERESRYAREFKQRTDSNFALKMLQDFWYRLKTKEEIAKDYGMTSRSTLEWPLKQIDFVSYPSNYKTLLNSSDAEGNRIIAAKTAAWNAAHPDLMYARNKHAAQFCKTPEYREAQSQRIINHDKTTSARKEKISMHSRESWALCPEVKKAMSEFAMTESKFVRKVIMKSIHKEPLTNAEKRIDKGFYKRFWAAHPELIPVYQEARLEASKRIKKLAE